MGRERTDVLIVGAGLIGLAVGRALVSALEGVSVVVVDKEGDVAAHQSGHNSGVVHSGLYYRPGSLKARLCVEGREAIHGLCEDNGIPHSRSGKLVIATRPVELAALEELERRGRANGLTGLRRLGPTEIRELEPHATGIAALHVPEAGVADFPGVAERMAVDLRVAGAEVLTERPVTSITHTTSGVEVEAGAERFTARILVNCAGLQSDRVAVMAGLAPSVRIVPFRGEYYELSETAADLVRSLIYPVPDPRFPFLGVHFTRGIGGTVEVGPNAVLALGREHYRDTKPAWRDVGETLIYPGFLKLAARHLWAGSKEVLNSRSANLYARAARRLVPALERSDLVAGGVGVRAQAVDRAGNLIDDFVIEEAGKTMHVLNAPSPGATASLAIGRHIGRRVGAAIQAR